MEKWMRGLSKTNALIFGIISTVVVLILLIAGYSMVSGLVPLIILGAIMGGGVGFSLPLIYKGVTGYTPQERKELEQKKN